VPVKRRVWKRKEKKSLGGVIDLFWTRPNQRSDHLSSLLSQALQANSGYGVAASPRSRHPRLSLQPLDPWVPPCHDGIDTRLLRLPSPFVVRGLLSRFDKQTLAQSFAWSSFGPRFALLLHPRSLPVLLLSFSSFA
jgi:hypothetical protein